MKQNLCLDNWTHRLGFESACAALCKWAAFTLQTLSKTFANSLNMQKQFEKMLGKRVMTRTVTDKSTYHEKPHFDLFFTTISTSKKMFFFRARPEKGIVWHIDTSSVVETLIYHCKLANQIARLAAIVVKLIVYVGVSGQENKLFIKYFITITALFSGFL